jgi:hypothetical protein
MLSSRERIRQRRVVRTRPGRQESDEESATGCDGPLLFYFVGVDHPLGIALGAAPLFDPSDWEGKCDNGRGWWP